MVTNKTPNATESEAVKLFPGVFEYEAHVFTVCGGDQYTPDWVDPHNRVAIEVKGEYIHSRDGRRRFLEAKHLYPNWTWVWARKRHGGRKGGRWEIERYEGTEACPRCGGSGDANNAVSGGAERRTLDGLVGHSESKGE